MTFKLRTMRDQDGPEVLAIYGEGIAGGNATYDRNVPSWESWDTKFLKCCRLVAEDENQKVLGWAAIQSVSKRKCFSGVAEVSIYLSFAAHGFGIGRALLSELIKASEENGYWTLQSGIFPENEASLAIHFKLGFREVGRREKFGQMNGVWRDVVILERRSTIVG